MARRANSRRATIRRAEFDDVQSPLLREFGRPVDTATVEWDVRTVYDFVFSLSDDTSRSEDFAPEDRRWLERARDTVRSQVGEAFDLYASEFCIVLAGLAVDRPDVTDAAGLVRLLGRTDVAEIQQIVLGEDLRSPRRRDMAQRALQGDEAAIDQMMALLAESHPQAKVERFVLLFRDPETIIGAARSVLAHWLPLFSEVEPRVLSMIQRDHELRAGDRATLGTAELIERTTGGVRWLSEPGVERVILAPSYFARPFNFLLAAGNWRLIGYPIADAALDATDPFAPPQGVVRLHRALGDETRLRILRLLRDRDWYLTEIAERLELSKPTIKHHLAQLRSAGLVTVTEEGGFSYYSLRRTRLDDASSELKRFLVNQ